MLRRANPSVLSHVLKVGDLVLDRQQHRVYRKEKEVRLGPTEFRLLEYFMMSPGRVFSRSQLLDGVWGQTFMSMIEQSTCMSDVFARRLMLVARLILSARYAVLDTHSDNQISICRTPYKRLVAENATGRFA